MLLARTSVVLNCSPPIALFSANQDVAAQRRIRLFFNLIEISAMHVSSLSHVLPCLIRNFLLNYFFYHRYKEKKKAMIGSRCHTTYAYSFCSPRNKNFIPIMVLSINVITENSDHISETSIIRKKVLYGEPCFPDAIRNHVFHDYNRHIPTICSYCLEVRRQGHGTKWCEFMFGSLSVLLSLDA